MLTFFVVSYHRSKGLLLWRLKCLQNLLMRHCHVMKKMVSLKLTGIIEGGGLKLEGDNLKLVSDYHEGVNMAK